MRILALFAAVLVSLTAAERPQVVMTTSMGTVTIELFADQAPETVANFVALANGTKTFTDPVSKQPVTRPFFDGLAFHRVIAEFMVQGGCPLGTGSGGPGYSFADEINARSLGLEQEMVVSNGQLNEQCAYLWPQIQAQVIAPALEARGITRTSPKEQIDAGFQAEIAKLGQTSLRALYEKLGYVYNDQLPASTRPLRGMLAMANSGPATNGSQFFINLVDTPHLTGKHTVFGRVVAGMEVVDAIGAVATGPGDRPQEPVTIISIRSKE